MKIPFTENRQEKTFDKGSSYKAPTRGTRGNPFDDATEMDIATLTERVLSDDRNVGYVTSDGQVMPRNNAFACGYRDGLELVKERIWGEEGSEGEDAEEELEDAAIEVVFSEEAKAAIYRESMAVKNVETGGALIGDWEREIDGALRIHVERASGPGPHPIQKPALFSPTLDYYRSRVNYYREKRAWEYIGEWHKHPGGFASLSAADIEMAKALIRGEGWPLLLLPIVTRRNGTLFVENHVVLSRQLGGAGVFHAGGFSIAPGRPSSNEMTVYLDNAQIHSFRTAMEKNIEKNVEKSMEFLGVCNAGESYVFIPSPGPKNARIRLVHAGENVPFTDTPGCVTGIVGQDGVHCYHVNEGEIFPLPHVAVEPEASVYERNAGLAETHVLRGRTVTLVGCGSLGSTMGMSLARAGVGTFHLFDCDALSPANIARHQGDLRDLGRNKASVVRDHIQRVNPTLNVSVHNRNVVEDPGELSLLEDLAVESDLLICATDTDDSRMLVNSLAVRLGVKSLQVGLHERAASGIVHLYDPEEGRACFACHRRRILSESNKRAEGIAYSEAEDVRGLTIQPGLSAQIDLVAQVGSLRAIEALMGTASLPDLSIVYVDKGPGFMRTGGDESLGNEAANSPNGEEGEKKNLSSRRLQLRVVHLDLERVENCPVCSPPTIRDSLESDSPEEEAEETEEAKERNVER